MVCTAARKVVFMYLFPALEGAENTNCQAWIRTDISEKAFLRRLHLTRH